MVARVFLVCRVSRMTLSESELRKYESGPGDADYFRAPVDEHSTHYHVDNTSPERCHRYVG